jgi:hypothetical protein
MLLSTKHSEHPDIVTRAVGTGRLEAVQLVIDLGVDVNDPAHPTHHCVHDAA